MERIMALADLATKRDAANLPQLVEAEVAKEIDRIRRLAR